MPEKAQFIGIEIGGTKLQIVLGTAAGEIIKRHRLAVEPAAGGAGIRTQIFEVIPSLLEAGAQAIGVGFGGPVNWRTGQIACSHHVAGWSDFQIGDWLRDQTRVPVSVDNDANTAALGETIAGAGVGRNPVFYVTLGSGVGGGLVADGKIYHGAHPGEAEIGHMRLNRQGMIVEESCSGWAVDRKIREGIWRHPESTLARLAHDSRKGGEARFMAQALQTNDLLAEDILRQTCEDLGFALSHVTHLFHPEIIVVGGGLSLLGEPLRARLESALRPHLMQAFAPGPSVALAALGEDAVPVGALRLAADAISK